MNLSAIRLPARIIPVIFLVVLWALQSQAITESEQQFETANATYSQGDFPRATQLYEQLIEKNGYSAGILYNLANSYAKNGETGKAILNYERALKLSPKNPDILGNLNLLRHQTGLFPQELTWRDQILKLLNLNQWTLLGTLALVILTITLALAHRYPISLKTRVIVGLSCIFMICMAMTGGTAQYRNWHASVVLNSDARLLISPFAGAAPVGQIREGRLVYPTGHHGNFLQVEDESGRKGWIHGADIEPIIK